MKTDEIKWISFYGKDTGAINRSFYEKVKKFGFCLVLDEYGSDKASKVHLSILDTVLEKEKPNILLVCPSHLMHSWYRSVITKTGLDMKMISGSSCAISYFSKDMSNMYIISEDAVKNDNPLLKQFEDEGLTWDLMILDSTLFISGLESSLYTDNIKTKTEKLIIFSPVPYGYMKDSEGIKNLVKSLLADENKAKAADEITFGTQTICFNPYTPVMRYFDKSVYNGDTARNTVVLEYEFSNEFIQNSRKLVDLKTGLPLYAYGGNVFEEYGLEAKKIYTKPAYNIADVATLREVDKKLDCFLTKLDEVLASPDNKALIYCVTGSTISYLKKVISALHPSSSGLLKIDKGDIFNTRYGNFTPGNPTPPRITITVDKIGSISPEIKNYTHIFNYELPDDPVTLEYRAARHSIPDEQSKEYIFFCDKNGLFDSRMLSKVLFGKIYRALVTNLPGRNILFDLPCAAQLITGCIKDLQYVCGYTGEVANCLDVITHFRSDYNIAANIDLSSASRTHEYTALKLEKIYRAFGIEGRIKDNSTDEKALRTMIKETLDRYAGSLLYLDEQQKIIALGGDELKECLYSDRYEEYKSGVRQSEMTVGIKSAEGSLENFIPENKYNELRICVTQMPDTVKMPVLLNTWRYLTENGMLRDSFKQFMKNYNEGVM